MHRFRLFLVIFSTPLLVDVVAVLGPSRQSGQTRRLAFTRLVAFATLDISSYCFIVNTAYQAKQLYALHVCKNANCELVRFLR